MHAVSFNNGFFVYIPNVIYLLTSVLHGLVILTLAQLK